MLEETYALFLRVCGRNDEDEFDFMTRKQVGNSCAPYVLLVGALIGSYPQLPLEQLLRRRRRTGLNIVRSLHAWRSRLLFVRMESAAGPHACLCQCCRLLWSASEQGPCSLGHA